MPPKPELPVEEAEADSEGAVDLAGLSGSPELPIPDRDGKPPADAQPLRVAQISNIRIIRPIPEPPSSWN